MNRLTFAGLRQRRVREIDLIKPRKRRMFNHHDGKDDDECERRSEQEAAHTGFNEFGLIKLAPHQSLPGTCIRVRNPKNLFSRIYGDFTPRNFFDTFNKHPSSIALTNQDAIRWKMASRAFQTYYQDYPHFDEKDEDDFPTGFLDEAEHRPVVVPRCKDWPGMEDEMTLPIIFGFSTAALIYGGLHSLAWFAHFDSSTELSLWRISACVVMSGVPISWHIGRLGVYMWHHLKHLDDVIQNACFFLVVLIMLAYVLARAYLVVECFINLSHLPAGVYDVPTWSAYFPHIS